MGSINMMIFFWTLLRHSIAMSAIINVEATRKKREDRFPILPKCLFILQLTVLISTSLSRITTELVHHLDNEISGLKL